MMKRKAMDWAIAVAILAAALTVYILLIEPWKYGHAFLAGLFVLSVFIHLKFIDKMKWI